MSTILTIAIPTYNRSKILKENLRLIFDNLSDEINILVCDNHSIDKTYLVCKEYVKFNNFKYIKNKKNLGYDANVLAALTNSNSKYVWFLSDDDFVDKDKIMYIYKYLQDHNPDAVLLNAIVKNKNTGLVLIDSLGSTNDDIVEFCNDSTFVNYIQWSTLISSNIVKKENVSVEKAREHIGSEFIQLSIFWNSIYNKNLHILGSLKVIKYDAEKANFNLNNIEIWFKSWITIVASFTGVFTKKATKAAATKLYTDSKFNTTNILTYVLLSRSMSIIHLKDFYFISDNLNLLLYQRFIIVFILIMPSNFISFSIRIGKILKRLINKR